MGAGVVERWAMRLAAAAVAIFTAGAGVAAVGRAQDAPVEQVHFEPVTIPDIAADPVGFDGRAVVIRGTYLAPSFAYPACIAWGGGTPTIIEEYTVYPSTWLLQDGRAALGIDVVLDIEGHIMHDSTRPNYAEGQMVELRGVVRATTLTDHCDRDRLYRSAYLQVHRRDADMPPTKPLS
jgi:hypothetical protein